MWDHHVNHFIWSQDQKSDVGPHFSHLDPRNAMEPLVMMLASCNANAKTSGVHDQKSHVAPHFLCLELRNAIVPLRTLLTSCGTTTDGNGVTDQKNHVAPHFDCY